MPSIGGKLAEQKQILLIYLKIIIGFLKNCVILPTKANLKGFFCITEELL